MRHIAVLVGFAWLWLAASCNPGGPEPARALEQRILAPCCNRQVLADHDSPLAHQLRHEIASRISDGEPPEVIEASLVQRYGEAIRVAPPWRWTVWLIVAAIALAGLAVIALIARNRRKLGYGVVSGAITVAAIAEQDSPYVDRLDDELAAFD